MKTSLTYKISKESEKVFLTSEDANILEKNEVFNVFDTDTDVIEAHVFTLDGILLTSDLNLTTYKVVTEVENSKNKVTALSIDPISDVKRLGYGEFDVYTIYNFLKRVKSVPGISPFSTFFVESISSDRTEVRISSIYLTETEIVEIVDVISSDIKDRPTTQPYFINFGESRLYPVINIGTQKEAEKLYIILKLYKPLPPSVGIKSTFSLDEKKSESIRFDVDVTYTVEETDDSFRLRRPNFDIDVEVELSNPGDYYSKQDLESFVENKGGISKGQSTVTSIELNVDYSDFNNFVHFSSAEKRIVNFRRKLQTIQNLQTSQSIAETISNTAIRQVTLDRYTKEINDVVKGFDHYDKFLFFQSGSLNWPKENESFPYVNQPVTSSESLSFYATLLQDGQTYDSTNYNKLSNSIPDYIKEDPINDPYINFVDMIGESFDNIWIYSKILSEKYNTDNRVNSGISKDLIADALRSLGVRLYSNDIQFENLFKTYTGEFYSTGSEQINFFITASNIPTPLEDYQKEIYKRIYHNLPFLLKSKGTEKGLKALLNIFGIPENILNIRYYGGPDTSNLPFFGTNTTVTGSIDKIKVQEEYEVIQGNTLSTSTSIESKSTSYFTPNLHLIEVGFSPTDQVDTFLKSSPIITGSFNIDDYIGDPRLYTEKTYNNLDRFVKGLLQNETYFTGSYNVYDFIRLVKFYDNTLFKMIKDFIPARANTSTGIIIKPFLLDISKTPQTKVAWDPQRKTIHTDTILEFTGSFYDSNFSYNVTVDTAFYTGSGAGAIKEGRLTGSYENYEIINGYDTSFTYPVFTSQEIKYLKSRDEAKYTGEFGQIINKTNGQVTGSRQVLVVTAGELNAFNFIKKSTEVTKRTPLNQSTRGPLSYAIFGTVDEIPTPPPVEETILFIAEIGAGDTSGTSLENRGSRAQFQEFLNSEPDIIKVVDDILLFESILYTGSINIRIIANTVPVSLTTTGNFILSQSATLTLQDVSLFITPPDSLIVYTGSLLILSGSTTPESPVFNILYISNTGSGDLSGNTIDSLAPQTSFQNLLNQEPVEIDLLEDIVLTQNILYTGSTDINIIGIDDPTELTISDLFELSQSAALTFDNIEIIIPEDDTLFINTGSQITVL